MNAALAALLVLATALGLWRSRSDRFRALRIALQVAAAVALWLCLVPPLAERPWQAGELVVLTPGATPAQRDAAYSAPVVALPGLAVPADIERVPDLATALRQRPEAGRLRIVGGGLPARDRDAARGRVTAFEPAPLPPGLVELDSPTSALAGERIQFRGRVNGSEPVRLRLRDPAGDVVAEQASDAEGRFALAATARMPGTASFHLEVLAADGSLRESAELPLAVRPGGRLRVLLRAGAPDPELKYLRRWAADAGLALEVRITLSEGIAFGSATARLDPATLAAADLLILDERAWAALERAEVEAIHDALAAGLGLLLRPRALPPPPVAADWAALGWRFAPSEAAMVQLGSELAAPGQAIPLERVPLAATGEDAATLVADCDGQPLAAFRNAGLGRSGVWLLANSERLELEGDAAGFGSLWSRVFATLARPQGAPPPELPADARVDQRATLCGLDATAEIEDPAGQPQPLAIDRNGCAAWWPTAAGWHRLETAYTDWPIHVRARAELPGLTAAETAAATHALVTVRDTPASATQHRSEPLPRWPFFLAFLALAALLWWLERRISDPGQLEAAGRLQERSSKEL